MKLKHFCVFKNNVKTNMYSLKIKENKEPRKVTVLGEGAQRLMVVFFSRNNAATHLIK